MSGARSACCPDEWDLLIEEFTQSLPELQRAGEMLHDHFALNAMGDGPLPGRRCCWSGLRASAKQKRLAGWPKGWPCPSVCSTWRAPNPVRHWLGQKPSGAIPEPGLLFELLAYQPKANPVVVLDELDKTEQVRQYDPLAALYTLLERRSARSFTDLSIRDFAIDASHINWIATANSVDGIPSPLLSRLTVLHVHAPTPDQVARIAQNIYGRMRAEATFGALPSYPVSTRPFWRS